MCARVAYAAGSALVEDESTDPGADKKIAAKRKALDRKPAAAKHQKKTGGKKKPATKKPKKETTYDIDCDDCGFYRPVQSWQEEETGQDFCTECAHVHDSRACL